MCAKYIFPDLLQNWLSGPCSQISNIFHRTLMSSNCWQERSLVEKVKNCMTQSFLCSTFLEICKLFPNI